MNFQPMWGKNSFTAIVFFFNGFLWLVLWSGDERIFSGFRKLWLELPFVRGTFLDAEYQVWRVLVEFTSKIVISYQSWIFQKSLSCDDFWTGTENFGGYYMPKKHLNICLRHWMDLRSQQPLTLKPSLNETRVFAERPHGSPRQVVSWSWDKV
jgi:hypothetical protein